MLDLLLYCASIVLFLYSLYVFESDKQAVSVSEMRPTTVMEKLGLIAPRKSLRSSKLITNINQTLASVLNELKDLDLIDLSFVVAIDFTASNEWQGRKTFNGNSLHKVQSVNAMNPYQRVLSMLSSTLDSYINSPTGPGGRLHINQEILTYCFGNNHCKDESVKPLKYSGIASCSSFQDMYDSYCEMARKVVYRGTTNIGDVVNQIVTDIMYNDSDFTIFLIITDAQFGDSVQVNKALDAIEEAADNSIGLCIIGVGDGPFDLVTQFHTLLPDHVKNNFTFVNLNTIIPNLKSVKKNDTRLALAILKDVPSQYSRYLVRERHYRTETLIANKVLMRFSPLCRKISDQSVLSNSI